MNKTLAIIGSHPRTRDQFDFSRTDVDVWLFNEAISNKANTWAKRADAIFQMHIPTIWRNPNNRNDPKHFEWLKTQTACEVYMQEEYAEVPMSRRYPLAEIQAMVNDPNHFLTSSVPQAMALAAYLNCYSRVEIYGVAMETNTEYQFQREGVSYWYGYLKGKGIDVYFADPTFEAPLYGYEGEVFIKYERFGERVEELKPKFEEAQAKFLATKSDLTMAVGDFIADSTAKNEQELTKAVNNIREITELLGALDGAIQENQRYQKKADDMRTSADGEFVFSRQEFESGAKNNQAKVQQFSTELISLGTLMEQIHRNVMQSAKGSPKHRKYADMYRSAINDYLKLQNMAGIHRGVMNENFGYMAYLDKHIRAAGGTKSEEALLAEVAHV